MFSTEVMLFIRDAQRLFNDRIIADLEAIKQEHAFAAYAGLALIGFLYGAFHAVGPGHGKVVVSSYMLANENSLKRGLAVVGLSSLLQAMTAIALVVGFYHLLKVTRAEAEQLANMLAVGSIALVGMLGLGLIVQGILGLRETTTGHHHHCEFCGHAHGPSAHQLTKNQDIAAMAAMILSIGIRPCTGALLLLFFACALDLAWPGIFATFAMAAGTALTTGALAILAVKSKNLALRLVKKSDRGLAIAHALLRIFGGLAIILMAGIFIAAGWSSGEQGFVAPPSHPLF